MRIFLLLLTISLTACSPYEFAESPASKETFTVKLSHDLFWVQDSLNTCLPTYPEASLFIQDNNLENLKENEISIRLGMPSTNRELQATLLGKEEIYIITNEAIDNNSINIVSIRNSYLSLDPQFQAWAYPSGNQNREIFDSILLESKTISPQVKIAPNPEAMLEAVSNNPAAIGYIPNSWKEDTVQVIPIGNKLEDSLFQPILALTNGEPKGNSRLLLSCLHQELQY